MAGSARGNTSRPVRQADALSEAEWDFRELVRRNPTIQQQQELHAAIRYEYARESESIRKLGDEFADLPEHELEEHGARASVMEPFRKATCAIGLSLNTTTRFRRHGFIPSSVLIRYD